MTKKANIPFREQVARNLLAAMRSAGIDNVNQLSLVVKDVSDDQMRNILRCDNAATVDTLSHLAEGLRVPPSFLLVDETTRKALDDGRVSLESFYRLLDLYAGTTDEGRKMIRDIAELQPRHPSP